MPEKLLGWSSTGNRGARQERGRQRQPVDQQGSRQPDDKWRVMHLGPRGSWARSSSAKQSHFAVGSVTTMPCVAGSGGMPGSVGRRRPFTRGWRSQSELFPRRTRPEDERGVRGRLGSSLCELHTQYEVHVLGAHAVIRGGNNLDSEHWAR